MSFTYGVLFVNPHENFIKQDGIFYGREDRPQTGQNYLPQSHGSSQLEAESRVKPCSVSPKPSPPCWEPELQGRLLGDSGLDFSGPQVTRLLQSGELHAPVAV